MEDQIASARKWIVRFGFLGSAFFIITLGIYFINFHGPLDSQQAQWGVFGDYLGGILNPILSFLAFLGLLWTISLNYDELRRSSESLKKQEIQQQKQDIYRLIETIYSEIKGILNLNFVSGGYVDKPSFSSLKILINAGSKDFDLSSDLLQKHKNELLVLTELFLQFKFYLSKYDNLANDNFTSAYFKKYFITVILDLSVIGVISDELKVYYQDFTISSEGD